MLRRKAAAEKVDIATEWNLKVCEASDPDCSPLVDIATEWNLKDCLKLWQSGTLEVDIATEWNLKVIDTLSGIMTDFVDIATEWNLKVVYEYLRSCRNECRYSNRMEFKVSKVSGVTLSAVSRYSNRMEFKALRNTLEYIRRKVDIATEWNLKYLS